MDKTILSSLLEMHKSDILQTLYEYRENEGDIITSECKETIRKEQQERKSRYTKFEEKLKKNIKDEKSISEIIELFKQYEDSYNNEHGLYYEQYYKTGIKNVIKLILQCVL